MKNNWKKSFNRATFSRFIHVFFHHTSLFMQELNRNINLNACRINGQSTVKVLQKKIYMILIGIVQCFAVGNANQLERATPYKHHAVHWFNWKFLYLLCFEPSTINNKLVWRVSITASKEIAVHIIIIIWTTPYIRHMYLKLNWQPNPAELNHQRTYKLRAHSHLTLQCISNLHSILIAQSTATNKISCELFSYCVSTSNKVVNRENPSFFFKLKL